MAAVKSFWPRGSEAYRQEVRRECQKLTEALERQYRWLERHEDHAEYATFEAKTLGTLERYCAVYDELMAVGGVL